MDHSPSALVNVSVVSRGGRFSGVDQWPDLGVHRGENAVAESRSLDYKAALPSGGDEGKREFLCDVSSFANTVGGCLIYGVTEIIAMVT